MTKARTPIRRPRGLEFNSRRLEPEVVPDAA
jgi:hypothetical protein